MPYELLALSTSSQVPYELIALVKIMLVIPSVKNCPTKGYFSAKYFFLGGEVQKKFLKLHEKCEIDMYSPLWFLSIFQVYAIILKVKKNIKPQIIRIYSVEEVYCPILIHTSLQVKKNLGVRSLDLKLRVLVLFMKS